MKRYKYVRIVLFDNGYTTSIPTSLTLVDIDADGYLIYNNENGDQVKGIYNSSATTLIDSNTVSVTPSVTGRTMATGATYQLTVLNEDSQDVTFECTFATSNAPKATVSASGLITAVASGTATITITHEDGATSTVAITVS